MPNPLRIAMWSGPRNLSTAIMRSFSSRTDAAVLDEPFYAHYLMQTGIAHPGRDDVIGNYETDWKKIVDFVTGPVPGGKSIWYQKHMAHHMLPHIDSRQLLENGALIHAFLIRNPAEVISSYTKVHNGMTIAETGLPYQVELFLKVRKATGKIPPVIDAKDVLIDPKQSLSRLCRASGSNSQTGCSVGRPARIPTMVAGHHTGTPASIGPLDSNRISPKANRSRRSFRECSRRPGNFTINWRFTSSDTNVATLQSEKRERDR